MAGEFLYFSIYVFQQLGIMLGVGAQTVLLCTHLIAVYHGEEESPHASYARAARVALGAGLFLVILSGAAAVAVHALEGRTDVLLAPAFLFKWLLIVLLVGAFLVQNKLAAWSNTYFAFAGGTWYALFLVHSLGPVTSWAALAVLYALWSIFFAVALAFFVMLMRSQIKKPTAPPAPKPAVKAVVVPVIKTASWWRRLLAWVSAPKKQPAVVAAVAPPLPPPVAKPAAPAPVHPPPPAPAPKPVVPAPPVVSPKPLLEVHHQPLSLPVAPPLPPVVPKPMPASKPAGVPAPPAAKPSILQEVIDHLLVPALRIMPQRPEDIAKHNRPPVVK